MGAYSISGTCLIEDIWYEIFLRLPLEAIFKFRCVSKVWFSILSNPSFTNSWYKFNNLSLPWGLVNQGGIDQYRDNTLTRLFTIAYPDSHSHSNIVSHHRKGFSCRFLNTMLNDSAKRELLYILGSSKGLVLCATYYRRYYVCNPLTKKSVSLPPPPSSINFKIVATGFICNECDSVSYKVILIPQFEAGAKNFKVEIFSSDLGEWNTYDVSRPPHFTWHLDYYDNFVTHNGVFYWTRKECRSVFALSVDRNVNHGTCGSECKLINLPDQSMEAGGRVYANNCLGESEGSICYARIKDTERSLSVWVLKEDWCLVHEDIKFHDTLTHIVSRLIGRATVAVLIRKIWVLGFSPVDKNVVILSYEKYILAYNTRTKEYEQLCHPSVMGSNATAYLGSLAFVLNPRPTILPPVTW